MLNKNFNSLISAYCRDTTTAANCIGIDGASGAYVAGRALNELSTLSNAANMTSQGTGIFLFTDEFEEDINTFILPTEFTNYNVTNTSKTGTVNDVGVSYTRVITPSENATIKSVALVTFYTVKAALLAFENLAEPVQLTAGEPHTFTFTIKV